MEYEIKVLGYMDTINDINIIEVKTYRVFLPAGMPVEEWFESIEDKQLGDFYPTSMESYKEID